MRSLFRLTLLAGLLISFIAAPASAAIVDPVTLMPGSVGTSSYGAWNDLSAANVEAASGLDYPGHPGTGAWPAPVANQLGTANSAQLTKIANGPGVPAKAPYFASVGPWPGTTSLGRMHYAGFTTTPNTNAGTLGVGTSAPLAGLTNLVFQVETAEVFDYTFFNNTLPTLNYNGGEQGLQAKYSKLLSSEVGPIFSNEPTTIHTWALQWDLSALGPINDFQIQFTGVEHSDVYGLRVDQFTNFSPIPEPSTIALAATALVGFAGYAVRRRK